MNVLLAFIQLITILFIILFEYKQKSTSVFMWGTLLLMFGLPHFFEVLFGVSKYNMQVMIYASIFVVTFCFLYLMGRMVSLRLFSGRKALDIDIKKIEYSNREKKLYFLLALIPIIIYIIYSFKTYGSILNTSWNQLHSESHNVNIYSSGSILYLIYYFSTYLIYAYTGVLIFFLADKSIFKSGVIIVFNFFFVVISRNRMNFLPVLISIIILLLLKYQKKSFQLLIKGLIFGIVGLYLIFAIQAIRLSGDLTSFIDNFSFNTFNKMVIDLVGSESSEFALKDAFYYFIYNNNNFPGFGKLQTYMSLIFLPIPHKLTFGLKPIDFAITMGSAYIGNTFNTTFSMHPTLFGDVYANLGMFGVFLGIFWAFFVAVIDNRIINAKYVNDAILYLVIVSCMYILIGRGSVYFACRMGFISSILVWSIRRIFLKNDKNTMRNVVKT